MEGEAFIVASHERKEKDDGNSCTSIAGWCFSHMGGGHFFLAAAERVPTIFRGAWVLGHIRCTITSDSPSNLLLTTTTHKILTYEPDTYIPLFTL